MGARLYLGPDTHLCPIDDGAIVLDLQTAKYFGLDSKSLQTVLDRLDASNAEAVQRSSSTGAPEIIETLLARGILTHSDELGKKFEPIQLTMEHSMYSSNRPLGTFTMVHRTANLARAVLQTKRLMKPSRLRSVVHSLRDKKQALLRRSRADIGVARELVSQFMRVRPLLYTARDHCLFDSLVLMQFLMKHGIAATLVFGVATKPFAAHAWVQIETTLLNETVEEASLYRPILVI